jgi:thiosulfate/3-mercaptopyruvate sulfurtransferase
MDTLVDVEQLRQLLDRGGVMVFDCRFSLMDHEAGRNAYSQTHIPSAFFADMESDLSTPHIPGVTGRHPLPERNAWIAKVSSWGIQPQCQVVAYDDAGGAGAARLWWMLQWIGHENVAVLDGGWQAWKAAGLPVTADIPAPLTAAPDHYSGKVPLVRLMQTEEINPVMLTLLDARELARFRGEVEPIDPVAGHIPGAFCSPFSGNLNSNGKFRTREELREKFTPAEFSFLPVVCYCGSGVTACHNILAMKHAGLNVPALYGGSWSEWITDPGRKVATGD